MKGTSCLLYFLERIKDRLGLSQNEMLQEDSGRYRKIALWEDQPSRLHSICPSTTMRSGSDGHSSGMAQLHGKAALVTGGAKGIGKAICEALIRKHVKVCIADIDTDCGNKTAVELQKDGGKENVIFVRCDITSDEQFEAAFATTKAKFGHLDILINNAGIGGEEKWSRTVDVNVKGTMRGTTLAFRHLMHKDGSKGGHVINMASILGLRNNFLAPAYCASKHAIVSWSQCWGHELNVSQTGVKVNTICPKSVNTEMYSNSAKASTQPELARRLLESLKEAVMEASVVADGVVKILEDDVTGSVLVVTHDKGAFYYSRNDDV